MKNRKRVLWVTNTAIFLALLIIAQAVLKSLGQYVLGTVNNLIFILTAVLLGFGSSVVVSLLSPLLAFFLGFGPAFPQIIPIVMLGNLAFSTIWVFIAGKGNNTNVLRFCISTAIAAVSKFLILWLGIVVIAVPLLSLPEKQAAVLSAAFSYPQLITASLGSFLAFFILPPLTRILKKEKKQN